MRALSKKRIFKEAEAFVLSELDAFALVFFLVLAVSRQRQKQLVLSAPMLSSLKDKSLIMFVTLFVPKLVAPAFYALVAPVCESLRICCWRLDTGFTSIVLSHLVDLPESLLFTLLL